MADAFIGEIRILPYIFNPAGWWPCDGRQLNIQSYAALYSLLGTRFGGDGKTTFSLPNLAGFIPVSTGTAATGTPYTFAGTLGSQTVTLVSASQLGGHTHLMSARHSSTGTTGMTAGPNTTAPLSKLSRALVTGSPPKVTQAYSGPPGGPTAPSTAVAAQVAPFGGGPAPHPNMMPYLVMGYFINWDGIYPTRPN
jgi:microcystin-dependent protein